MSRLPGYVFKWCDQHCSSTDEGTTISYVPLAYPAVADRHVVDALARAAKKLGYNFAEGITHSKDAFYAEIEPDNMPNSDYVKSRWQAWERSNVMCSEMELLRFSSFLPSETAVHLPLWRTRK